MVEFTGLTEIKDISWKELIEALKRTDYEEYGFGCTVYTDTLNNIFIDLCYDSLKGIIPDKKPKTITINGVKYQEVLEDE